MKTIIIGIAGGTGSGKTTLTEKLRDHFEMCIRDSSMGRPTQFSAAPSLVSLPE